jgi:ribosomal protein L18
VDTPSKLAEIADRLLRAKDTDLTTWLQSRVNVRRTNQEMADQLREDTGGVVDVSPEAVRRWVKHYKITEQEPAA